MDQSLDKITNNVILVNYKPLLFYYICFSNSPQINKEFVLALVIFYRYIEQWNSHNQAQAVAYIYVGLFINQIMSSKLKYVIYPALYSRNPFEGLLIGILSSQPTFIPFITLYYYLFTQYSSIYIFSELSNFTESLLIGALGFEQDQTYNNYTY